jgi:RelA/SpoT family (p)ppGpp synthetase
MTVTPVSAPPRPTVSIAEDGKGGIPVTLTDPYAARLERIKQGVLSRFPRDKTPKISLLEKAFADSEQLHRKQVRKSGEPYILHPYRVALMACESGLDVETVIIALLHDVIEDTEITKEQVQAGYGDWLADVVDGLTKVPPAEDGQGDAGIATYRKLLSSTLKDLRTAQVKLFDRLDNMRDLGFLERSRQRRIARETLTVLVPMAQRLGMQDVSDELTALCFRYLYPRRFGAALRELKQRVTGEQPKVASQKQLLESLLAEQQLPGFTVKPRLLQISDFIHHDLPPAAPALTGFSITVPTAQDCYRALGALHIKCRVAPNSIKDFISNPRPNRYQALHSQVFLGGEPIAIVIASSAMEAVNRSGILAKWEGSQEELHRYYQSYLELLDQYTDTDDLRMEDVLRHAQMETLQMFTPKGRLLSLPQGATVIDFAFAIHSDLGLHCAGARMGGQWVSPFQELKDGEVVEIFTDPAVAPAQRWLGHARTTRAKLALRRHLKGHSQHLAQEFGRKLLTAELERFGTASAAFVTGAPFLQALAQRGLTPAQFFHQVGTRKIPLRRFLVDFGLVDRKAAERLGGQQSSLLQRYLLPMFASARPTLEVPEGGDGFIVLSPCCQPLAGDPIVGVQTEHGIRIHRAECPELTGVEPDSLLAVAWEAATRKQPYTLEVRVVDRAGMIYKISKIMRDLDVSIHDLNVARAVSTGEALVRLAVEPVNSKIYQKIIARLRAIKEVRSIMQVDGERHPGP